MSDDEEDEMMSKEEIDFILRQQFGQGYDAFTKGLKLRKHPEFLLGRDRDLVFSTGEYYFVRDAVHDQHKQQQQQQQQNRDENDNNKIGATKEEQDADITYPAVDLATGSGVYPIAFANDPYLRCLDWHVTNINDESGHMLDKETRLVLKFLCDGGSAPLFADAKGKAVFVGDSVELVGLKQRQYNKRTAVVTGLDLNSEPNNRYGVRLISSDSGNNKKISLKPENMVCRPDLMGRCPPQLLDELSDSCSLSFEDGQEFAGRRHKILQGLLDNSHEVDVLKPETWESVSSLYGKCAVVTCTNLLTAMGYRNPEAWQNCLQVASNLLRKGGIFITYDTLDHGGYGDFETMSQFCDDNSLDISLKTCGPVMDTGANMKRQRMQLLGWQKGFNPPTDKPTWKMLQEGNC